MHGCIFKVSFQQLIHMTEKFVTTLSPLIWTSTQSLQLALDRLRRVQTISLPKDDIILVQRRPQRLYYTT